MINVNDLVKNANQDNIIFKEYGIRPSEIAFLIAEVSNTNYDMGYIVIGAKYDNGNLLVNGISRSIQMANIIQAAKEQLNCKPNISYSMKSFQDNNVCVICVESTDQTVSLGTEASSSNSTSSSPEELKFINKMFLACVKLQRNPVFNNASEDQRNDFIRDILETSGYHVKDQTRQGLSGTGVSTGEVDLLVMDNDFPLCIVEALNLSSLNKSYLDLHLNKLYRYDTLGNKFNVVLSYVSIGDFGVFWSKYCTYIKSHVFPFQMKDFDETVLEAHNYSDIKYMKTTHDRHGSKTHLWHICVAIQSI